MPQTEVRQYELTGHYPIRAFYFTEGSQADLLLRAAVKLKELGAGTEPGVSDVLSVTFGYDAEELSNTLTVVFDSTYR